MLIAAVNNNSKELRALSDLLVSAFPGAVVYGYTDGSEVTECLRTRKPNAVFLGLDMHEAENMELLHCIRKQNVTVPVVVCADEDSMLEETMWNGASMFLVKPYTVEQIRGAMTMDF